MASLASKDSYFQSLGKKVCAQENTERQKRKTASNHDGSEESAAPKKKRKKKPRSQRNRLIQGNPNLLPPIIRKPQTEMVPSSFSTVDLLKKRLHEKIEKSRGQVSNKSISVEERQKRRERRKHERDRKKRKRKEMKMKAAQAKEGEAPTEEKIVKEVTNKEKVQAPPLVFNKVEVHDEPLNKVLRKKEKKEKIKGNITPMTGKNYKQLLSRLELRNSKLEALRDKDQGKAKEFESKIKWTNVLYKAEGLKIKDDEAMLKTALKRKEKKREQRKKRWDKRAEQTAEKMQNRQDKRSRNIKKKKMNKLEKKKNRARKRGRVMPEDLAKSNIK